MPLCPTLIILCLYEPARYKPTSLEHLSLQQDSELRLKIQALNNERPTEPKIVLDMDPNCPDLPERALKRVQMIRLVTLSYKYTCSQQVADLGTSQDHVVRLTVYRHMHRT